MWQLTQYFAEPEFRKTVRSYSTFAQAVANMSSQAYRYELELI